MLRFVMHMTVVFQLLQSAVTNQAGTAGLPIPPTYPAAARGPAHPNREEHLCLLRGPVPYR
jgi:hypothetical protein